MTELTTRISKLLNEEQEKHPNAKIDIYTGETYIFVTRGVFEDDIELAGMELSVEEAIEKIEEIEKTNKLDKLDVFPDYCVATYTQGKGTTNLIEEFLDQCPVIEDGDEVIYVWIETKY